MLKAIEIPPKLDDWPGKEEGLAHTVFYRHTEADKEWFEMEWNGPADALLPVCAALLHNTDPDERPKTGNFIVDLTQVLNDWMPFEMEYVRPRTGWPDVFLFRRKQG